MLGMFDGRRRREQEKMRWHHWLNGRSFIKLQGMVKDRKLGMLQYIGLKRVGHDLATEQ